MSESSTPIQELNAQSVVIDRAVPNDAEAIIDIKRQGWLATYPNENYGVSEEYIRHRVEGEHGEVITQGIEKWRKGIAGEGETPRVTLVARVNSEVEGFVALRTKEGKRTISALYVRPGKQGIGLGSRLMQSALEWFGDSEAIYLGVVDYNQRAIEFYEGFGFAITGKRAVDVDEFKAREIEMLRPAKK